MQPFQPFRGEPHSFWLRKRQVDGRKPVARSLLSGNSPRRASKKQRQQSCRRTSKKQRPQLSGRAGKKQRPQLHGRPSPDSRPRNFFLRSVIGLPPSRAPKPLDSKPIPH